MGSVQSVTRYLRFALILLLLDMLPGIVPVTTVRAASITVTTTTDAIHGAGGVGCVAAGGACSLRDAVLYANVHADTIITLPAGTYNLTIYRSGANDATTGDLNITQNATINGAGASTTIINATSILDRIFNIGTGKTFSIGGVTMTQGFPSAVGLGLGGAMWIQSGATVTVTDCAFTDNVSVGADGGVNAVGSDGYGGAIYNTGSLTVTRSSFVGNIALGGAGGAGMNALQPGKSGGQGTGGAIATDGTTSSVSITSSTFTGNLAQGGTGGVGGPAGVGGTGSLGEGGAIAVFAGTVTITGSTFTTNLAIGGGGGTGGMGGQISTGGNGGHGGDAPGGAIFSQTTSVIASNSTFVGNSAQGGDGGSGGSGTSPGAGGSGGFALGGGLFIGGQNSAITNATINGNKAIGGTNIGVGTHAPPVGAGIYEPGLSHLVVTNTIVSNNAGGGNCSDPSIVNGGHNLQYTPDSGCGNTPFIVGDPKLGPLASNGGPTQTIALGAGSAALDTGDDAACAAAPVNNVDQRGVSRPQGAHCDIGAFEVGIPISATALIAAPNPSTAGQAVTFTATVTTPVVGFPAITGTVTFQEGGATLGSGTVDSSGGATFTTSSLAVGSHIITAIYGGDAAHSGSTAPTVTQVVNPGSGGLTATTTTLVSSANPSTVGQSITFTALVMGTGGTLSGTVAFKDGATVIGTGTLTGESATMSTSTLTQGSHTITAVYSGDATFATSTSAALTQIVNPGGGPPASGLQFYPLTKPVRLLDTRAGSTAFVHPNTPLTAGQTLSLPGQFSYQGVTIPPTAQAIVGNATVANGSNGTPPGFATIFPSGVPLPLTSNLNFVPGTVRPNDFTVALGSDTKFNLYSSSGGDFVVDISGYYAPVGAGGLYFHPLAAPVRELDTRAGATAFVHPNAPLTAGQTLTLPGSFTANSIAIPSSAKALVGNATVANGSNGTPAGFATLFPDDVPLPLASNLNFVPGTVAPNAFTVALGGGDGGYNLYSSTGGDFVVDITGYLDTTAAGGLLFTPLSAPVRELDTRAGATAFVHPSATLTAGQTLTLPGAFTYNSITIPASAKALVGNATVANDGNGTPAGFATLYPDGVPLPLASNLNFVPKQVAPNAITVGIGSDGKYDLYSSSGGDFIIDITGYFAAASGGAAEPTAPPRP